jgi:hypothetical protein
VKVAYQELSLTEQVLQRQSTHAVAIMNYLASNCSLSAGSMGLLLMPLALPNALAVAAGAETCRLVVQVSHARALTAELTLSSYLSADRSAHDAFAALTKKLGASVPPFTDPRDSPPHLGVPASSADSGAGHPTPTVFGKAWDVGSSAGSLVRTTVEEAADRATGLASSAGPVTERTDPESYLVTPDLGESPVEDLRWSAGLILGGIDWVAEQFLGYSILEDVIMKPLGGDWQAIGKASTAWGNAGIAYFQMAENFTGLPKSTLDWQGDAAEAFRVSMAAIAAGLVGLSDVYAYVSGLVGTVASVAKGACSLIGLLLNKISTTLMELAVEGAIPVAGWVAAAATIALKVYDVISAVRAIQTVLNLILDAVQGFIDGKQQLVDTVALIEDLAEYAVRDAARALA